MFKNKVYIYSLCRLASFILVCLLFILPHVGYSQNNEFSIQYEFNFSKIRAQDALDNYYQRNSTGQHQFYRLATKPLKALRHQNFNFSYSRRIGDKLGLGLWFRQISKGLRSPVTYGFSTLSRSAFGGYSYIFRVESIEVGLSAAATVYKKNGFEVILGLSPSFDTYIIAEDYRTTLAREEAFVYITSSIHSYAHWETPSKLRTVRKSIKSKLYRFGLYSSVKLVANTRFKLFNPYVSIQTGWNSKLRFKENTNNPPDGTILLFNLSIGNSIQF